ncbi:MAG: hypothetical protein MUE69_20395 [Myxococcota bacterium]|jgi:hypothetical protein|nr:hypothetical protein [Myxococcota bacterium]
MPAFLPALQTMQRVRPDDPLARGVLDAPPWLVIVVASVIVVGVVIALVRRARKR